mgnify:CR=1 FL=1
MEKIKLQPFGLSRDEVQEMIMSLQKEKFDERKAEYPDAHEIHRLQDFTETWIEAIGEVILANNVRLSKEISSMVADLQMQIFALSNKK